MPTSPSPGPAPARPGWVKPVALVAIVLVGVVLARLFGLTDYLRLENLARITQAIEAYGALAPVVYIAAYVLAVVFFVPGLPMTLVGGLVFGPIRGTVYVWIGATIGAALAFLVARYALRTTVERWVAGSPRLASMDAAVASHGWRIVMLTRLVPLFPFNLQNYAYGLTRIGFATYALTTAICILPGTAAFTFAGGALSQGGDVRRTLLYLAIAGVLIAAVSLLPRLLQRKGGAAGALLKCGAGVATLATLAAAGPVAAEPTAYARLLASHVRPGTVSAIRLHLVDYGAVKADQRYRLALDDLQRASTAGLRTEAERLAFWINAYNLLAIKAVVDQYPTRSIRDGGSLLSPIWKRKVGVAAGREVSLDDVEHGILRREFAEPRIHLAIVCASLSCPDLRPEPYEAARLDAQLDDQVAAFLRNPTKGVARGADGAVRVSAIFKWFAEDFRPLGGVARFIGRRADPGVAAGLGESFGYLDYDWSLNDTARSR